MVNLHKILFHDPIEDPDNNHDDDDDYDDDDDDDDDDEILKIWKKLKTVDASITRKIGLKTAFMRETR